VSPTRDRLLSGGDQSKQHVAQWRRPGNLLSAGAVKAAGAVVQKGGVGGP
jgi:hypothetical protein